MVLSFAATAMAGCVTVPIDSASPVLRLRYLLSDAAVAITLCAAKEEMDALHFKLGDAIPVLTLAQALRGEQESFDGGGGGGGGGDVVGGRIIAPPSMTSSVIEPVSLSSPSHLIYTSGSTGDPKGSPTSV
eukprot:1773112-Pleurochrysis_carterae.AAC.4